MTEKMTPISTSYHGCRFRSRLEARWAVFFDQLAIRWEYEPQGYVVDGDPYLPDFLITQPGSKPQAWFEVKGKFPSQEEINKAAGLAEGTGIPVYLYFGPVEMPAPGLSATITTLSEFIGGEGCGSEWDNEKGWIWSGYDPPAWEIGRPPTAFRFGAGDRPGVVRQRREPRSGMWWWTDCPRCHQVLLKLKGQIGCCPSFPEENEYPRFAHETPRLQAAYRVARSARFEFGESPRG